ncbi:phosphatase 2C-like domain-containing protein [Sparassis latifolia]
MLPRARLNVFAQLIRPRSSVLFSRLHLGALHAGGALLLSLWGFTYVLTPPKVYLDSRKTSDQLRAPEQYEQYEPSPLQRQKPLDRFRERSRIDVDAELRRHEQTHLPERGSGIARYDIAQLASNDPIEDDHAEAILPVPSGHWSFFAILDGHNGWETSAWLRDNLIPAVAGALADLFNKFSSSLTPGTEPDPPPDDIEDTIQATFKRLDDDIVYNAVERVFETNSRHAGVTLLAPAYAGSCALLAFYDDHTRVLRIAVTGDSRAVLGRPAFDKRGQAIYEVRVLSVEQDAHNVAEEYRLNAQHPGEAVVANGRVLGMGPSRAFGDARYKWSRRVQERLKEAFLGRTPPRDVRTPPYLTAVPEVTSVRAQPGDFLILATDGLWESLTSAEAVGLVGLWQDGRAKEGEAPREMAPVSPNELPVEVHPEDEEETVRYRQWCAEKRFVNCDQNAATHLVRNALGGADSDLAAALMSMRSPRARVYRDDISAVVLFFE